MLCPLAARQNQLFLLKRHHEESAVFWRHTAAVEAIEPQQQASVAEFRFTPSAAP